MDAIDVSRHTDPRAPAITQDIDDTGTVTFNAAHPNLWERLRGLRGAGLHDGQADDGRAQSGNLQDRDELHSEHDHAPDGRRGMSSRSTFGPALDLAHRVNVLTPSAVALENPPSRARQGFTGSDAQRFDRTPVRRRAFTLAPFDQWAAQHPAPVDKKPLPAPRAYTNRDYPALTGGRVNVGASSTPNVATYTATPATVAPLGRDMPRPWTEAAEVAHKGVQAPRTAAGRRFR